MAKNNMGKTKRSTDDLINDAISQQNDWLENRREYTRGFLKKLNLFARPAPDKEKSAKNATDDKDKQKSVLRAYWLPIACAVLVLLIIAWALFIRGETVSRVVVVPNIPERAVQTIKKADVPQFDIDRVEKNGNIVVTIYYSFGYSKRHFGIFKKQIK